MSLKKGEDKQFDEEVQRSRIEDRLSSPLKQWKVSPVDLLAQEKWDAFTDYKTRMFEQTSTEANPWLIVKGNERERSRIAAIRHVVYRLDYAGKTEKLQPPSEAVLGRYSG